MTVDIIHADALWVHAVADGCDAMLVDPPYAAKVHAKAVSTRTGGAGPRKRDFGFESLSPELMLRIAHYASRVRRWTAVYTDVESVATWIAAMRMHGVEYIRPLPWVRWTQPQISGDRPPSGCEMVLLFHATGPRGKPMRKHWNGPGSLTGLRHKALRGKDKHPTEKPLDQLLDLVSWLSDPGEMIFDPCGGRGTTALAAELLGRSAVVLERDWPWVKAAEQRCGSGTASVALDMAPELLPRDVERAQRFVRAARKEAGRVPTPKAKDGSDVKTYERAQRRLADAARVAAIVGEPK